MSCFLAMLECNVVFQNITACFEKKGLFTKLQDIIKYKMYDENKWCISSKCHAFYVTLIRIVI